MGGESYRNKVGKIIDQWNLTQYDNKKFRDVSGHWAYNQIMFLKDKGWISGYSNGTFKPDKSLTRAEAATIINNFLDLKPTNEIVSFSDVDNGYWALDQISLVVQNKIMTGIGEGQFSPNSILTRAQMAQLFYNAGFYSHVSNDTLKSYIDVDRSFWAYLPIETMKQEGIMLGYPDGRFAPYDVTTRAQMAAIIFRIYEKGLNN